MGIKIHVFSNGDSSVGIGGCNATVDLEMDLYPEERAGVKYVLKKAFSEIFDDRAIVYFDDEVIDDDEG